ncbi:MAG: molybdenum cofactor biosynthesis protein MoaE [Thermodesulfobacteriota bacterium]|nr:molybdenum cofactor biosynthesis protein MoaE [Thermodesulfobacteriota bacterium]
MDINRMILTLKGHPDYPKMGMIASHLGIVRETSLNGGKVEGIEVEFDNSVISNIISEIKQMPGIIEVLVETFGGRPRVGDELMAVAVGGDTREHVFPALIDAVNRIKTEATSKKEF